jgi:predicted porin
LAVLSGGLVSSAEGADSLQGDFYGSLREHIAIYSNDAEFQDNSSRIGMHVSYNRDTTTLVYCHVEWSLKLVGSEVSFNADANSAEDIGDFGQPDDTPVFGAREGYFGLKRKWGWLTVGKQWSVYSKVARMAEKLVIFGGEANGCYSTKTDGGGTGTGRADRILAFYSQRGPFTFAFQEQMKGNTKWLIDGFGGMLKYHASEYVDVGGAFNLTKINAEELSVVLGVETNGIAGVIGVSYDKGSIYSALVVSRQENLGVAEVGAVPIIHDATGLEFYFSYDFRSNITAHAGIVSLWPDREYQEYLSENFKTQYLALGLKVDITEQALFYVEGKINNGYGPDGERGVDVLAVGLETDFSFTTSRRSL